MTIKLLNNGGKKWQKFAESYVKGFAFIGDHLLNEEDIFNQLFLAIDNKTINETVNLFNGNFSAVIKNKESVYLFSDKVKSYPLLYSVVGRKHLVTDQAKAVLDELSDHELNDISVTSYLAKGYLHDNKTFVNDCFIVPAGKYVVITGHAATEHTYHKHIYAKKQLSDMEIMEGCMITMENSFRRMIKSIGNRPMWIPLSGGYDSRLIACICKKFNVPNIKCFTYGIPESNEVKVSKQVADHLGFPWYCVTYSKEKFLALANTSQDDDYILWGMNLNTTSHFQDFVAIKELRDKGLIEDNAVIVPGHSGEILGRFQVPYQLLNKKMTIAELIYFQYFQWNTVTKKSKKKLLADLGRELNSTLANENRDLTIDLFTNWNIHNRQANFIVNAVRLYEYFNLDWRIPLWDDELSKFWYSLDSIKNSDVILYNKFLFEKYFIPMGVDFYKKNSGTERLIAKLRLPFGIKDTVKFHVSKWKYFKIRYDENGLNSKTLFYLNKISQPIPKAIRLKKSNANAVLAMYQIDLISKYIDNKVIKS